MTGKEAYRIWAPAGARWTDWVRPVPFVTAGSLSGAYCDPDFHVPAADYVDEHYEDAAVIVDLPGAESVREGIALAKAGYRPVPIYNGTVEQPGSRAATDNRTVGTALIMAAEELAQIRIREDAPPAFLTDSGRMNQFRMEASLFDNSWECICPGSAVGRLFHKEWDPESDCHWRENFGRSENHTVWFPEKEDKNIPGKALRNSQKENSPQVFSPGNGIKRHGISDRRRLLRLRGHRRRIRRN